MKELISSDDYLKFVRFIATTQKGKEISAGKAKTYPMEAFRDDAENAIRELGFDLVDPYTIEPYARKYGSNGNGNGLRPLHQAIAEVCEILINRHRWATPIKR